MNNLNNPHVMTVPVGVISASGNLPGGYLPKASVILGAVLINNANLAQSDTNYVNVQLKNGSAIVVELTTKVTQGAALAASALAAQVAAPMGIATATYADGAPEDLIIPAGTSLTAAFTVGGTGALAGAMIQISYYPL